MKKIHSIASELMTALLVLLWVYAALVKLLDPSLTLSQMRNQVFPIWMANFLAFAVPILEMCIALLLLTQRYRKQGLWLSAGLLFIFTIYIVLIKLSVFGRIPCSCGGIISRMSWSQHLLFNVFFLALSLSTIIIHQKERRLHG